MRYKVTAGPPEEWFPLFLKRDGKCLLYTGATDSDGYGQLPPQVVSGPWGSTRKAHRLAFALANGYLPHRGRDVCHTCDRPACCEPAHLYDGTPQQNADDMVARGRSLRGRKRGPLNVGERNHFARLTASQVVIIRQLRERGASLRELANEFGISESGICLIVTRKKWRHVA